MQHNPAYNKNILIIFRELVSLAELFPQLQPLSREDKLMVMEFLKWELAIESLPCEMTA